MMTLIHYFIKGHQQLSDPDVKKAYAVLSSTVGIILNLFLCAAKVGIGYLSHSIAITADGFNNLSDAGTSLVSLIGFKIAGYGIPRAPIPCGHQKHHPATANPPAPVPCLNWGFQPWLEC